MIITDDSDINTPAVAAAYAVKRYNKQAQDEISFEVRKYGLLNVFSVILFHELVRHQHVC